ncbi:MAG: glycoside hydrolase family 3 protein [Saccharofermentans sp.]|nr:glycoside hydrolase family 3 protein [Saccharofermentans sp.]
MKKLAVALSTMFLFSVACQAAPQETTTIATTQATTAAVTQAVTPIPTEIPYVFMPYEGSEEAQAILSGMSLEEKVYQMFMVSPEQLTGTDIYEYDTEFNDVTEAAIAAHPVGGVIFFGGNIVSPEQITEFVSAYQEASDIGLFIGIDEEGGDITRIASNPAFDVPVFPPMAELEGEDAAYDAGNTIGSYIQGYGFNLDFAPVSDVNSNPDNTVIGNRAFSSDPQEAAVMVSAAVRGFNDSGVFCTLKHFPGHGDTVADTHFETASVTRTYLEMQSCELIPFAAGIEAGADFIMAAHITTPNADPTGLPASLSYFWLTTTLRYDMGFTGIIITDSMTMQAITDNFTPEQAAVAAVYAGNDIILMPQDLEAAAQGIVEAVENGTIPEERIDSSVLRILDKKIQGGII